MHKDAVLNALELVKEVKALDSQAEVQGEKLLSELLEKIEYLEKEKDGDIWYTQVSPTAATDFFKESKVTFEGYFYNVKYIDKVLIGKEEVNLEYIPKWEFKNSSGNVIYTGPAFKYQKEIEYESGYYEEKITAISESGRQNNLTARFFVDTIAPQLDLKVKGVNSENETGAESVEIEVTMKDNFYDLTLYSWGDNFEFSQEASSNSQLNKPANVSKTITLYDLDMGENEITFRLVDALGNETAKTISITRIGKGNTEEQIAEVNEVVKNAKDALNELDTINSKTAYERGFSKADADSVQWLIDKALDYTNGLIKSTEKDGFLEEMEKIQIALNEKVNARYVYYEVVEEETNVNQLKIKVLADFLAAGDIIRLAQNKDIMISKAADGTVLIEYLNYIGNTPASGDQWETTFRFSGGIRTLALIFTNKGDGTWEIESDWLVK